ncbi:MAG: hypothetical protein JWR09_494 [Mucilaginibacter sp.]|nr:hypothetical protein [Mucilaginibacter sp.]
MLIKLRPEYKKGGIVIVLNTINIVFTVNKYLTGVKYLCLI